MNSSEMMVQRAAAVLHETNRNNAGMVIVRVAYPSDRRMNRPMAKPRRKRYR